MEVKKTSFVFHFEYLADIPEEYRAAWALRIVNYAERGIIPEFSDWRDVKTWNAIQNRIDAECMKYHTRAANLKQNKEKNLHSLEKRFSDTEEKLSDTEQKNKKSFGHREENTVNTSDTEEKNEISFGHRSENVETRSECVYVSVSVYVYVFVIGYVPGATNQPTTDYDVNTVFTPFILDKDTLEKIQVSLNKIDVTPDATALNYAFNIVSAKTYGAEKTPYNKKTEYEQKAIFINALLKYPSDVFVDFEKWKRHEEHRAQRLAVKRRETEARKNPPKFCACGNELTPKGAGFVCLNCRKLYEIVDGNWSVTE